MALTRWEPSRPGPRLFLVKQTVLELGGSDPCRRVNPEAGRGVFCGRDGGCPHGGAPRRRDTVGPLARRDLRDDLHQ
jgi:hypothetical protein